jgi:hypothetical protein
MDTTIVILTAGTVIAIYLLCLLFREPGVQPVIRDSINGATVEKCPHCNGVVGVSLKESVTWRISQKDVCPHCNRKIKR